MSSATRKDQVARIEEFQSEFIPSFVRIYQTKMIDLLKSLESALFDKRLTSKFATKVNENRKIIESSLRTIKKFEYADKNQNEKLYIPLKEFHLLDWSIQNMKNLCDYINRNLFEVESKYTSFSGEILSMLDKFTQGLVNLHVNQFALDDQPSTTNNNCLSSKAIMTENSKTISDKQINNYINHPINTINNYTSIMSNQTLEKFAQGDKHSCKIVYFFVLECLQNSFIKYKANHVLLKPLNTESIFKNDKMLSNTDLWEVLIENDTVSLEDLKKAEQLIIPIVGSSQRNNSGVAFVSMKKFREHVEVFSGVNNGDLHSRNSCFYFIR